MKRDTFLLIVAIIFGMFALLSAMAVVFTALTIVHQTT